MPMEDEFLRFVKDYKFPRTPEVRKELLDWVDSSKRVDDLYACLELTPSATRNEVRTAFRARGDVTKADHRLALFVLGDGLRRQVYDRQRGNPPQPLCEFDANGQRWGSTTDGDDEEIGPMPALIPIERMHASDD
jgi:hypothetical protein